MIFSLLKIYISNLFSLSSFFSDFKKGPKKIIKNILILLLGLFCISSFAFLYVFITISMYDQLKIVHKQNYLPVLNFLSAAMVLIFFGFFTVSTNYANSSGEEQFLAMPLRPIDLFGAKFLLSVISDIFLSIFIILISCIVYGIKEQLYTNPLFYFGILINCVSIPVTSVFVIYFVLVVILFLFPLLRNKKVMTVISVVFVILFSLSFNLGNTYVQKNVIGLADNAANLIIFDFLSSSISGNILADFVLLSLSALVLFVFIPLLAPVYIKTLNGFTDGNNKRKGKNRTKDEGAIILQKRSVFWALLLRDIKTVLKEPAFFCNGPLIIFLFPLIILISSLTGFVTGGGNSFNELKTSISSFFITLDVEKMNNVKFMISLITSAVAIFLGNSSNIAITSFSREGKFLSSLKAMPIDYVELLKAKFFHALSYCFIADFVIAVFLSVIKIVFAIPISVQDTFDIIIQMILISTSASVFLISVDMLIDFTHPKLQWENPVACFKQNLNTIFSVFASLIVSGILFCIGFFIVPKNQTGLWILLIVFVVLGAISGKLFIRIGVKKMQEI